MIFGVREATQYLNVSPTTLAKLRRKGEIPAMDYGGRYHYAQCDLDAYLSIHRTHAMRRARLAQQDPIEFSRRVDELVRGFRHA